MTRKEEIQNNVLKFESLNLFILEWATGCGKSKAALDLVKTWGLDKKVILFVAETAHKDNWLSEMEKFNIKPSNITIECYASMKNYADTTWDIVIFDEAHKMSLARCDIFYTMKCKKIIALSATLTDEVRDYLRTREEQRFESKIPLWRAIKEGLIPPPKVFLVELTLDNENKNQEIILNPKVVSPYVVTDYERRFDYYSRKDIRVKIRCTERQKYDYIEEKIKYYISAIERTNNEFYKLQVKRLGLERKSFLAGLKTDTAKFLCSKLTEDNIRFVCFASSTNQLEKLTTDKSVHSKKSRKEIDDVIEKFQNKEINQLYCNQMMTEGVNLKNIEAGIIVQLDKKSRTFTQKLGRTLRAEEPLQYVIYFKDTSDEKFVNESMKTLTSDMYRKTKLESLWTT
jgi:superfamily II DNA or RNA helicase